jgi:hypothetical protein
MDVELLPKPSTTSTRLPLAWATTLLSVLLWLGGCSGPTSVTSLRQHPKWTYSFEVPADCPTVYLRIARRAQERYRYTNLATFQPGVTATLAPDAKTANVTFFNAGGFGLEYLLTADLCALEPARTEVTAYCADRRAAQESLLWQQWANTPLATTPADPNQ